LGSGDGESVALLSPGFFTTVGTIPPLREQAQLSRRSQAIQEFIDLSI
jgi:hypothetical protein